MQRLPYGSFVIEDNALIKIWRLPCGSIRCQGKRVPASNPLSRAARRAYVESGRTTTCIKYLIDNEGHSISSAWELFKKARGITRGRNF